MSEREGRSRRAGNIPPGRHPERNLSPNNRPHGIMASRRSHDQSGECTQHMDERTWCHSQRIISGRKLLSEG